jgi:hypothetical protein
MWLSSTCDTTRSTTSWIQDFSAMPELPVLEDFPRRYGDCDPDCAGTRWLSG